MFVFSCVAFVLLLLCLSLAPDLHLLCLYDAFASSLLFAFGHPHLAHTNACQCVLASSSACAAVSLFFFAFEPDLPFPLLYPPLSLSFRDRGCPLVIQRCIYMYYQCKGHLLYGPYPPITRIPKNYRTQSPPD